MKNKILKISLISIIVTCILVMLTGCTLNNITNENNQIEENKVKNEVQNTEDNNKENKNENENINTQSTSKTDNEIVEDLFLDYLKNIEESSGKKLKEYKIDKVKILSGNERKNVIATYEGVEGNNVNERDIFAEVTYSVKPENIENTEWMAGNGEKQGDWLVNKSACVFIKYDNGTYKIQGNGTGW